MKNSIWEYIDLANEEKETLWENATFVFDANVLLNLYRYSSKTGNILIGAFEKLSDRIWIPHQVAYEFMKNRCEVIFDVCNKYDSFERDKEDFLSKAKSLSNLQEIDVEITQLRQTLDQWIETSRSKNIQVKNPNEDVILNRVLDLFDGKTGTRYDTGRTAELKKIGEKRFLEKIPPGYEDNNKKLSDKNDNNAFGDFFVWMQTIDYATVNHKDIIYVTSDQKEDWWYKVKGRTVGPRVELRKEFRDATGQLFHMYSMNFFIEYYSKKYNHANNESVIEEVKRVETERNRLNRTNYSRAEKLAHNISRMEIKIQRSQRTIDSLLHKYVGSGYPLPSDVQTQINNTKRNLDVKIASLNKMKEDYSKQLLLE